MFSITYLLFGLLTYTTTAWNPFPPVRWGNPISIASQEIHSRITHELSESDYSVVKKLNGFYGMIGPNINVTSINKLYDLFTGDGNIQGVFFNNGELAFTKTFIRTEKLLFEEEHGQMPKHFITRVIFMFLNKVIGTPNFMGVANTAMIKIKNKIYALFERDHPYLIDIDVDNQNIKTVKKTNIAGIETFSAHSKYDPIQNLVHTIDYNFLDNSVSYYSMDDNFEMITTHKFHTSYLPLTHDFIVLEKDILICDSPLFFHIDSKQIPVKFHKDKPTIFRTINKKTGETRTFPHHDSFYIFHYADYRESDRHIEIYASVYENLDFSELNINGKYRHIAIDKQTGKVHILKNPILEKHNLDFPIKMGKYVILRNIENNRITGFLVCDGLSIRKRISLDNKSACGEPIITEIDGKAHLVTFAYDQDQGYIVIVNMETFHQIEIPIQHKINIGFHSIYVDKK